jgi:RimJ/RimL family protein N-acetyltransferase
MMAQRMRRLVIGLSIATLVLGLAFCAYARVKRLPVPVWDAAAMAYGGVFCLFLLFNHTSRQLAAARLEADGRRRERRPPRRPLQPGQAVVPAPAPLQPQLRRVRQHESAKLRQMTDMAVREVLALESRRPRVDEDGRIVEVIPERWLDENGIHTFFITMATDPIGCCAMEVAGAHARLLMFYVASEWRRQRIGRTAMRQLLEFAALAGVEEVAVEVSAANLRAQNFLRRCGFVGPQTNDMTEVANADATRDTLEIAVSTPMVGGEMQRWTRIASGRSDSGESAARWE